MDIHKYVGIIRLQCNKSELGDLIIMNETMLIEIK